MPEPAPAQNPQPQPRKPAPQAPGLGELFEQSLAAVFDPSVFARAAARPAPSFGAAGGLALAAGAAALAVNLAHAAVESPGLLGRFSPLTLAAVGVAALGLYASLLLLLAVALHAVGNGFGGKGEFERGLQTAAMISVLAPLQMLCGWFPAAWAAPALLAAWVAAGALEQLFRARPGPSRAVCAALAAGALGLQFAGRALADRARDAYAASQAVREAAGPDSELMRSVTALALQAQAQAASAAPAAAAPATSGLDLLRGPSDGSSLAGSAPAEGESARAQSTPAGQSVLPAPDPRATALAAQNGVGGMLDALAPMLDALASSKNMTPERKADIKELQGMLQDLKAQMTSGKRLDNAVFAQKMSRYQALLMKVMAAAPPPAAPAKEGR